MKSGSPGRAAGRLAVGHGAFEFEFDEFEFDPITTAGSDDEPGSTEPAWVPDR